MTTVFLLSPANTGGVRAKQFTSPRAKFDVSAPGFGLVPPDFRITEKEMKTMRKTPVDVRHRGYRKALERDALKLAERLDKDSQVVLLGSVASGKYVDILWPIFGDRLRFPSTFAGLGDMSRGGLLLRAVRANRQLQYTSLNAPRHRAGGTGKIPDEW
jgi:hypothetical protein